MFSVPSSLSTKIKILLRRAAPESSSPERLQVILFTVFANFGGKILALLISVLGVGLTVPYLGIERFGIWMTIAGLAGVLTFIDLGIANALINRIAAISVVNKSLLRDAISGGLLFLFCVSILFAAVLFLMASMIPWTALIKLKDGRLYEEVVTAAQAFALLFSLSIFSGGVQKVFHGMQKAYVAHAHVAFGSSVALLLLIFAAKYELGIPWLLAATLSGQAVACITLLTRLFREGLLSLKNVCPTVYAEIKTLTNAGFFFFILQICGIVGWGADTLIISSRLGAEAVATFAVCQRLYQFVSQPLGILNSALWPALANAKAHGDKGFVRAALVNIIKINLCFALAFTILVVITGDSIIGFWTAGSITAPLVLLSAYGVWTAIDSAGSAFATFLNACGFIKEQVYGVISLLVLSLPLKLYIVSEYGIAEMIMAFSLLYGLNIIFWFGFVYKNKVLQELR